MSNNQCNYDKTQKFEKNKYFQENNQDDTKKIDNINNINFNLFKENKKENKINNNNENRIFDYNKNNLEFDKRRNFEINFSENNNNKFCDFSNSGLSNKNKQNFENSNVLKNIENKYIINNQNYNTKENTEYNSFNNNSSVDIMKMLFEDFIDVNEIVVVLKKNNNIKDANLTFENSAENSSSRSNSVNFGDNFENKNFLNENSGNFFDNVYTKFNNISKKSALKRKNVCLKLLTILQTLVYFIIIILIYFFIIYSFHK